MNWFANFPDAGGFDRPPCGGDRRAALIPAQPKERKYLFQLGFLVPHQSIVIDIDNVVGEQRFPMRHEPPVLAIVMSDIQKVQGVAHAWIKIQEINRQTVIQRSPDRMNDFCGGK